MSPTDHWLALARSPRLALLTDLDGTLIPFAASPDAARPDPELLRLLAELAAAPGMAVAIVSGRTREALENLFEGCPGVSLVAEHGGWRRCAGAWEPAVLAEATEVESLSETLRRVAARIPGALVERKTWSVAFHVRAVRAAERDAAIVEAEHEIDVWLRAHPKFGELRGSEVIEVRPAQMDKSSAVAWLRQQAGDRCRLLALGDDITDEDAFGSLGSEDESVLIAEDLRRITAARWRLRSIDDARRFLAWLLGVRRGTAAAAGAICPERIDPPPS